MKLARKFCLILLQFVLLLSLSAPVLAGAVCSDVPPSPESVRKSLGLALKTRDALDDIYEKTGARVAIVARAGQNLSQYGLHYSHLGFVWRDHPQGRWIVVHMLNECGTASSNLYDQGLGNFFNDNMYAWDAQIIIPSPAAQEKLAHALADPHVERLHEAHYSMVAYPWSTQYQNSNQWVLEMLNEGYQEQPAANREQAQAWLKLNHYEPSHLHIPALTRLGERMFRASIAFDDHPNEQRFKDRIDTVTVDSIASFMTRIDPLSHSTVVRLQ